MTATMTAVPITGQMPCTSVFFFRAICTVSILCFFLILFLRVKKQSGQTYHTNQHSYAGLQKYSH